MMPVPDRHATAPPWWQHNMTAWQPMDGDAFRKPMAGAGWTGPLGPGDPRLGPGGDVARRGTIPDYVTYGVLNPGNLTTTVQ